MAKLEDLKKQVATLIEGTQDTKLIESLASINESIKGVEEEQTALYKKNEELAKSYKNAILHGGYTDKPIEDTTGTKVVDFDTMLKEFINSKENK